jgi:hypothetical protein
MYHLSASFLPPVLSYIFNFFLNMDSAYLDIVKIFAGSIGWIGGLSFFMWWKDRNKKKLVPINIKS